MAEPSQTADIIQRLRAKRVIRIAEDSNLWTEIDPDNAVRVDAAAEIERLRGVLTDIANERGHCQTCGRLCDRDSNCTPIDCDRSGKGGCTWAPMDAAAFAKEALAHD